MHCKQQEEADRPHQEGIHSLEPSSSHMYDIQATQDPHSGQPGFLQNPQNRGCKSKQTWILLDPNPEQPKKQHPHSLHFLILTETMFSVTWGEPSGPGKHEEKKTQA